MSGDEIWSSCGITQERLLEALWGRDEEISPRAAARIAVSKHSATDAAELLHRALSEAAAGSGTREEILGGFAILGGDQGEDILTSLFAELPQSKAVRAARSLALTASRETLDLLPRFLAEAPPRLASTLSAAMRMIAFRESAAVELPAEPEVPPNRPRSDDHTVPMGLSLLSSEDDLGPLSKASEGALLPGVELRFKAAHELTCLDESLWLIPAVNALTAEGLSAAKKGRAVLAALAAYDACGSDVYVTYVVGFDGDRSELHIMRPDGRITHTGPATFDGRTLWFEATATRSSHASELRGSYDVETGDLSLSGTTAYRRVGTGAGGVQVQPALYVES